MHFHEYLDATDQNCSDLARLAEMPDRSTRAVAAKNGSCGVHTARKLVEGSKLKPALTARGSRRADWHITYEHLADGAIEYLNRGIEG